MLPGSFFLRVICPLNLKEFNSTLPGYTHILIENAKGSVTVGQVLVQVNGPEVNILVSEILLRYMKTLLEQIYMKNFMKRRQLFWEFQLVRHFTTTGQEDRKSVV